MSQTLLWFFGALLFGCFVVGLKIMDLLGEIAGLIRLWHNDLMPTIESIEMDIHGISDDIHTIKTLTEAQREDPAVEYFKQRSCLTGAPPAAPAADRAESSARPAWKSGLLR